MEKLQSDSAVPPVGVERTRRSFVASGIAAVALSGPLGSWGPRGSVFAAREARNVDGAWRTLARSISGPVLRPGDPGFAELALPYNLRAASVLPAGIARCLNAPDVAEAIKWSRRYGFPLVARSGGHSSADFSVTRGLMIDTKLMNQAQFDGRTGVATIGGGCLNADVYRALRQNDATITHGRCPTVGAAGFLLGGGIGFNIRRLGVAVDSLVASQIVTADGEIVPVSEDENGDFFWACRGGGGGNFGINTSFSVQTSPAPASVTASRLIWDAKADTVLPALLAALEDSPTSLGSWTTVTGVTPKELAAGQDVSVVFEGQLVGPPTELAKILAPVYTVAQPAQSTIEELGYWDAQENFFSDTPKPTEFQNRSLYFFGPVRPEAIETALYWLRRWPGTSIYANLSFLQTGGQASTVPADATAFVHRDNNWFMLWYLKWSGSDSVDSVEANLAWLGEFYDAISPYAIPQAYQNFPDPSLTDFLQQYYATNLRRLEKIKAAVDPHRVFNFPQAIPPASGRDIGRMRPTGPDWKGRPEDIPRARTS